MFINSLTFGLKLLEVAIDSWLSKAVLLLTANFLLILGTYMKSTDIYLSIYTASSPRGDYVQVRVFALLDEGML